MLEPLRGIAVFAILLGVLVFVHELGHFLAAKACGVKVLRFSFGFGPRLIGFRKGETDYCLSLLPLGGYVLMAGAGGADELAPEEAHRSLLAQSPWKRALIAVAGPFFSLAFPVLVYFLLFLGSHQEVSSRVASVEPGLPAAAAGVRPGDRILAVDGQPVRTFSELQDALRPTFGREVTVTVQREGGQGFVAQLTPAKVNEANEVESVPRGLIGISPYPRVAAVGVPAGSPAAAAGLQTFDRIVAVNGQKVASELDLDRVLAQAPQGPLTLTVERPDPAAAAAAEEAQGEEKAEQKAPPAKTLTLTVERQPGEGYAALGAERADLYVAAVAPGGPAEKAGLKRGDRLVALDGRKLESSTLLAYALADRKATPFALTWRSGSEERQAQLAQAPVQRKNGLGHKMEVLEPGFQLHQPQPGDGVGPEMVTVSYGVGQALGKSFEVVPRAIGFVATIFGRLFTGKVPLDSVGGPILLYQVANKSAEAGLKPFLEQMALISINLGLVNLIPIPIMDGFNILVAVWEGVRRRPVTMRAREVANFVGLAMLVILMVLVMFNDITR